MSLILTFFLSCMAFFATVNTLSTGFDQGNSKGPTVRKIIKSSKLFKSGRPYSAAVLIDKTLYMSGQIGWDINGTLPDGIEPQTKQTFENIGHVLSVVGANYSNVVRCMVFLANIEETGKMSAVYETFFQQNRPTRTAVEVTKLPVGALIEVEAIAIIGDIVTEEIVG